MFAALDVLSLRRLSVYKHITTHALKLKAPYEHRTLEHRHIA